jgi:signal peptidase II
MANSVSMLKWLWLSATVIILDQVCKGLAEHWLQLHVQYPVIPFFNLTLVHNTGGAFSFLSQAGGWQRWFFSAVAIIVSSVIVVWLMRLHSNQRWLAIGLSLVLGGALGNLLDRVRFGHVIDFIDVYYKALHWPTFNIADSAIALGATLLIVHSLFMHRQELRSTER